MSVNPAKYRPLHASERLLPKHPKHGYTGCRIAAAWMGIDVATLGESGTRPDGREKGGPAIRADLSRMWTATGDKDRDGYNQSHVDEMHEAMGVPPPVFHQGTFAALWADKKASYSLSINPAGCPTLVKLAAQRGWTNVNHQVLLLHADRTATHGFIDDPMRPQAGAYRGDKVPRAELEKAAKSPALKANGKIVAERYTAGAWTTAATARQSAAAVASSQQATIKRLRQERNRLAADLAACQAGSNPDIEVVKRDARTAMQSEAIAAVAGLKP